MTSTPQSTLQWAWLCFDELSGQAVYDMLALRARVFILEQGPFLDPDGCDQASRHLFGRDAQGDLRAYLRVTPPGMKYHEPSLGRVVMDKALRGQGLAHALVAEGLARCAVTWPGQGNRISAQAHLQGFYRRHGFVPVGAEYAEDDIPHIQMWKAP